MNEETEGRGEYVVGFLDILGFKYHLETETIETMRVSLERILIDYKKYLECDKKTKTKCWRPHEKESERRGRQTWKRRSIKDYTMLNFSDCIIIYSKLTHSPDKNKNLFVNLCEIMNDLIVKPSIVSNNQERCGISFACRAGISIGEGYVDRETMIFFGQPFTRAYALQEQQQWMGGAIDHENIPEDWILEYCGYDQPIVRYPVPGKDKRGNIITKSPFALNWPQAHWCEEEYKKIMKRDGPRINDILYHLEQHDWGDQRDKKENTTDFAEHICELWDSGESKTQKE